MNAGWSDSLPAQLLSRAEPPDPSLGRRFLDVADDEIPFGGRDLVRLGADALGVEQRVGFALDEK